ncbi:hypothetical protein HU200_016134 [Digitaria exilis]|uniref:Bifunctional inhibitor/plant lipid transfer protein/seed storage helical domain-containing protein n=1 Tax=Digitaria exilis TaxID=1010633 RepID=A0A835FA06_9POAL|nr:hypothetical protein HU200_016134 [Digitaria exilis]
MAHGSSALGLREVAMAVAALLVVVVAAPRSCAAQATSGCGASILSLAPCLSFTSGSAAAPTGPCCSALAGVLSGAPRCLCAVLGGGASAFGVTVNSTRALELPGKCKVTTPPVSQCDGKKLISSRATCMCSCAVSSDGGDAWWSRLLVVSLCAGAHRRLSHGAAASSQHHSLMMAARTMGTAMVMISLVAVLVALACSQAAAQGNGCSSVMMTLSPCMDFISSKAPDPGISCCSVLAGVVQTDPRCLCMVLDGTAASFGISINQTRALDLPEVCKVQAPPISQCSGMS